MMKYPLIPIILLPLLTSACGKDTQSSARFSSTELRMERIETVAATPEQCANGGNELRTYIDTNSNSLRDEEESVITSFVICSGMDGLPGQDGQDGLPGQDGQDGVAGQNGSDGKDGADGKDGVNGKDGQPAYSIVFLTSNVALSCENGGSTISFALDVNRNGVFDPEDTEPQSIVVCHGSDGKDGAVIENPTPADFSCKVSVKTTSSWKEGYVQEVTLHYFGDEISGWSAEFELPESHSLVNLWDASTVDQKDRIVVKNLSHNGYVKNGWKITFGLQAARSDTKLPELTSYRLNGVACQ